MKGVQLKVKTGTGKSRDREGGSRAAENEASREGFTDFPKGRDSCRAHLENATSTVPSRDVPLNHTKISSLFFWKFPDRAQYFVCNTLQYWLTRSQRAHSHFFNGVTDIFLKQVTLLLIILFIYTLHIYSQNRQLHPLKETALGFGIWS